MSGVRCGGSECSQRPPHQQVYGIRFTQSIRIICGLSLLVDWVVLSGMIPHNPYISDKNNNITSTILGLTALTPQRHHTPKMALFMLHSNGIAPTCQSPIPPNSHPSFLIRCATPPVANTTPIAVDKAISAGLSATSISTKPNRASSATPPTWAQ